MVRRRRIYRKILDSSDSMHQQTHDTQIKKNENTRGEWINMGLKIKPNYFSIIAIYIKIYQIEWLEYGSPLRSLDAKSLRPSLKVSP